MDDFHQRWTISTIECENKDLRGGVPENLRDVSLLNPGGYLKLPPRKKRTLLQG